MNVIVLLILASLVLALVFLGGFIWAVKTGQFEDTITPSLRLLADDEPEAKPHRNSETKKILPPS